MLNFFAEKKRLFTLLSIALVITAIAFTVVISQEQQTIRQKASGKQISLFFTSSKDCNVPLTGNIKLTPNQPMPLSLCLSAAADYVSGISGFNITLSANNNLTFQSADAADDAARFDSQPLPQRLNLNKAIHFTRIRTSDNVPTNPLRLLDFTVMTPVAETGNVTISMPQIVSLTSDNYLSVDDTTTLSYNSGAPTPNPTCGNQTCSADQICLGVTYDSTSFFCTNKGLGAIGAYCGDKNKTPNNDGCASGYCNSSLRCAVAPTPTTAPNLFTCETLTSGAYKGEYGCFNLKSGGVQCPNSDWIEYAPPTSSPFTGTSCETNVPKQGCCVKTPPASAVSPNAVLINLVTGTNFISLPVTPPDTSIAALIPASLASKIDTISYYDTATGTWNVYATGPAADTLSTLEPGKGYLFQMNAAATLALTGTSYEFQQINLVANKSYAIGTPATAVKVSDVIGTCSLSTLKLQTVNIDGSQSTIPLTANTLFEPKKGYWISSPTDCSLNKVVPVSNTTLVLNLNVQDAAITGTLSPEILILDFATKKLVIPTPQSGLPFAASSFPGVQYSATMPLSSSILPQGKYLVVARERMNNTLMTAKAAFTISSANQTINLPTKTLVFGDLNKDDNIDNLDYYNMFRYCMGQLASANINSVSCAPSDFDNNGSVNQVDFNTFVRGLATWSKEGKEVQ